MTPIKVEDTDELANYYDKALLDRQFLNYPMIVTTHVSLFNIMFGILKGDVSGFYQLCNSVVVLDEIQSYKISIWGEIINFLNVFAQMLNMKVIIMSATLPDLSYFSGGNSKMTMLIKDREKYFLHSCFKNRVKVFYELFDAEDVEDELYLHIKKSVTTNQKVLVEFISTKTAKKFFERFISDEDVNVPVEYLSGEDSTFERKRILDKVKETHSILLIATQVIEAGVDLDMDIGYKDIAKVDSEEQFMGRINRSCLRKDGGMVYFFDLDRAKGIYRNDARIESDFSIRKEKMQQILANKDYGMYYSAIMNIIKMNYGDTVNKDFYTNCVSALMFHEVSEHMKLIEEDTFHVSVFFARDIEELNISGRELWDEYRGLLKDIEMDYAEKQIKLSRVKSKMNMFIYQITKKQKCNINYNDVIGELFYIEEGEKYFEHGKLKREVLDENFDLI
jgi:CRISPR-associated endonuclease/helicase Cas3